MGRAAKVLLAAMLVAVGACGVEPSPAFAGWPEGWVKTYQRFQKFIAAQNENVPVSDLAILPQGKILTSLPGSIDRDRHTSIVFYSMGAQTLESGLSSNLFDQGRESHFPPRTYTTCLETRDKVAGSQFRHPLVWFEVKRTCENLNARDEGNLSVQMIDQPEPAEEYWPNDRLLRYFDFLAFKCERLPAFFRENYKVEPHITIAVTPAGVVLREKLDDSVEKLLHWRIFHNGRLVEKGSAAGEIHHPVIQGTGTYVIFVGVEGSDGFMPVSNFLEFPLFPERDGTLTLFPSVNEDGVPYCLLDALTPDQMVRLRATPGWRAPHATYNAATIYGLSALGRIADAKKQALESLWSAWAWSVDMAKANPKSDLNRIQMAPETK